MRFLNYLATLTVTLFLAACGGGGGSPGLPSLTKTPITTTAPAALVLAVGSSQSFRVIGGAFPMKAINSSSAQVATAALDGDSFSIYAVSSGASSVVITDSLGQTATIAVTVQNLSQFFTTAPASLVVQPGSAMQTYAIGGGQPPYAAVSDNSDIASVVIVGGTVLQVTPKKVGSATITVRDSATPAKASVSISVTVQSLLPLAVSPTSAKTFIDMPVTVRLNGGTPPYSSGGFIPQAVTVAQVKDSSGRDIVGEYSVTPLLVSSALDITFLDSTGASVKFSIEGQAGTPQFRVSPSELTVSETDTQIIRLTVFGAVGEITAFSSDLGLFTTNVDNVSGVVTVSTGTINNRCVTADTPVTITVVDSTRASGTSVITIKSSANNCAMTVSPSALTLSATTTSATANILQGTAPFFVSSSNTGVATVTVAGSTVTVTRVAAGSATITVTDSSLRTATIAITVN